MLALKTCCWQQFYIFKFIINRKPPSLLFSFTRPPSVKKSPPSRFALRWYVFTRVVWCLRTGTRVVFLFYTCAAGTGGVRTAGAADVVGRCSVRAEHTWWHIVGGVIIRPGSMIDSFLTNPDSRTAVGGAWQAQVTPLRLNLYYILHTFSDSGIKYFYKLVC